MITAPISLQDLRRRLYVKAKAEKDWRFWGLYVYVAKSETLHAAYALAKQDHGAPGIDGVTFTAIEEADVEAFLAQLRAELLYVENDLEFRDMILDRLPPRAREIVSRSVTRIRDTMKELQSDDPHRSPTPTDG